VVPAEESDVAAVQPSIEAGVGGIILLGAQAPANLGAQLAAVTKRSLGGVRPLVMTDEEGGEIQRMSNLVGSLPWPRTMTSSLTPRQVQALATKVAKKMAANGVSMDLAPVLDIAAGPGPDAQHTDGPRSFSPNPATAARYGLAFAKGLLAGGVIPVVKHFPGEGNASANSDDGPAVTPPIAMLERADLRPFEAAIAAKEPVVMVGNATVPGLSSAPASLSATVITGLLRKMLGFKGLVITDSLSAEAISDVGVSVAQAAASAVKAGADMVLFNASAPNDETDRVVTALVTAVNQHDISLRTLNNAVTAVLRTKQISLCGSSN
jgi:beta-N-acetylhexosaminidase